MKNLFLVILVIVIYSAASAQSWIGIKAGANFPDLTGKDATSAIHNKTGFYTGILLNIRAAAHFHIQPELLWSSQGYKYTELGSQFKTTFNYIHLLALGQYKSKGFCVETGPQLGVLSSVKRKGGILGTEDIKDSFKPTAFSWTAGIGYRDPFGYGIDLRYTIGLGSIADDANTDVKFNVFMLGISKTFKLAGKKK
ncbi:MAG: porin family protein [Bacteroidota bacterium]|nr:porin family protein [Bacteroidota bacterium]